MERPSNGLGMSRAAPIEREGDRANSRFQNADDLGAAKRRRLHARVGRQRKSVKIYFVGLSLLTTVLYV